MIDYAKVTELFNQADFQEKANTCETMDDFHKLFTSYGVDITEDETVELISKIAEKKQQLDDGEIPEEDLDNVAGGLAGVAAVLACIGVGALCIGAAAATAYVAYQTLRWANQHKCK